MLQEAFVDAFAGLHRLREPGALRGWLCSVVTRRACKLLRRHRLLTRLGLRRNEPVDLDQLVSRQCPPDTYSELSALYGILGKMPAEVRVVLVLRRVDGYGLEEIASLTRLSLATVKRRLAAGETMLSAITSPKGGEP